MIYLGIPNSQTKSALCQRTPVRTIYVHPVDLAYDCDRHIDFLRTMDGLPGYPTEAAMLKTAYCQYLMSVGRSPVSAVQRAIRFLRLAEMWRDGQPGKVWATVTEDGLRLDGSHRAAIAVVAGLHSVPVAVVVYTRKDEEWRRRMLDLRTRLIRERKEG